jgi:hypothetical protein
VGPGRDRSGPTGKPPKLLELPLLGLTGKGAILSSGARYARSEPPQWEYAVRWANNLTSPRMAIVEGQRGCLAVWADRPYDPGNLVLAHDRACDHFILRAERSALNKDPAALGTTTWRLAVFGAWLDAARRYRSLFEKAAGPREAAGFSIVACRLEGSPPRRQIELAPGDTEVVAGRHSALHDHAMPAA